MFLILASISTDLFIYTLFMVKDVEKYVKTVPAIELNQLKLKNVLRSLKN